MTKILTYRLVSLLAFVSNEFRDTSQIHQKLFELGKWRYFRIFAKEYNFVSSIKCSINSYLFSTFGAVFHYLQLNNVVFKNLNRDYYSSTIDM